MFFAFLIVYVFALYPIIVVALSKIVPSPVNVSPGYEPDLTVCIAAHNEERFIEGAVESIFESDYPIDKIKVIVGSDGSEDATVDILKKLAKRFPNLSYYDYPRAGKNRLLNRIAPKAKTELLFYLDADCRLAPHTLKSVALKFSDPFVGAVLSRLTLVEKSGEDNAGRAGESIYQKFERIIRVAESRIYSSINSLGTLYGIRRTDYAPLPNDLVCDDLYNLLHIGSLKKRIIYDEKAEVFEIREKSLEFELSRRVRLASGGLSAVAAFSKLLSPVYGWTSFFLWSHKLLRWFLPVYMLLILVFSPLTIGNTTFFAIAVSLQLLLYASAIFGYILEKADVSFAPFRLPLFFIGMNIAFALGLTRFFSKKQNARWDVETGLDD